MDAITLRPEVSVRASEEKVHLDFAHWSVTFPGSVITADETLGELFQGRAVSPERLSEQAIGIVQLLDAQGCLLPEMLDQMTALDVLKLFQPLRSQLYAEYYRHPVWERIRSGAASRGELEAWMIHNYHVSRSAGVIAARMASFARNGDERAFFQQDALEEYWHCDAFYFVRKADVELNAADVKAYVPLPASTGFEEHALRMGEEDPIAHLLIAYFQESSIVFHRDSEAFYDQVEQHYGIPGAFIGWRRHMSLDLDHDHAGELEARFDDRTLISREDAERAIRNAHIAQFFLLRALDEIAAHADKDNGVSLRQPSAIANKLDQIALQRRRPLSADEGLYLLGVMRDAAFHALAFSRAHDDIIAAGRFAALIAASTADPIEAHQAGPWLVACRNFLMERSTDIQLVLDISRWLAQEIRSDCPELAPRLQRIDDHGGHADQGRLHLEVFRLRELLVRVTADDQLGSLVVARQ